MATYRVTLLNNTGNNASYAFFMSTPQVNPPPSSGQVFSNVWMTRDVPAGGNTTITLTEAYYAWAGTLPQQYAPGVTVSGGQSQVATLATSSTPGSDWHEKAFGNSPTLATETMDEATPGCFAITTTTDFTSLSNFGFGISQPNPDLGYNTPIASFQGLPNMTYVLQPIVKFYIAQYSAPLNIGNVVEVAAYAGQAACVDFFTNNTAFGATVSQGANGAFSQPQYASQLSFIREMNLRAQPTLGTEPFNREEILKELHKLSKMIKQFDSDQAVALPPGTQIICKVGFNVAQSIAAAGATAIAAYMVHKGYKVSAWTYTTSADGKSCIGGISVTPPPSAAALGDPTSNTAADWQQAVASDTNSDGHYDVGVFPSTAFQSSLGNGVSNSRLITA